MFGLGDKKINISEQQNASENMVDKRRLSNRKILQKFFGCFKALEFLKGKHLFATFLL